jgi:hypothetical protein
MKGTHATGVLFGAVVFGILGGAAWAEFLR